MNDLNVIDALNAHVLFEMLLFAFLGLGLEVFFTAILDCRKDKRRHLLGYSSLWYLPVYMLPPLFFEALGCILFPLSWILRGLIYMFVIFACEYLAMFLLRQLLGASPSEESYYGSRWNIHGLIRLDFAPAMFFLGLIMEFLYRQLS